MRARSQRYLGERLLIFSSGAAEANRCQCVADAVRGAVNL